MNNVYDILEICLRDIENGADIDTVLFRYPEFADELRPILEASARAKSVAVPDPSIDVVRRNRAKVLQHAAQLREAKAQPSRRLWSVPLRRALVSLAVIAALFLGSTGLVRAASATLPGDELYPVKRTWEGLRILFTFDVQARAALEVEHKNERLEELYEVFAEGRSVKVDFAGLVTHQNGDLWLVSKIPVVISAQTDLRDGSAVIGDAVRVRGVTQADGTVLAERVDVLDAGVPLPEVDDNDAPEFELDNSGNANESGEDNSGPGSENEAPELEETQAPESDSKRDELRVEGTVDSVNGSIVIVDGRPMDISNAEIRGTVTTGVRVTVEGYYADDGVFIVTKIEFAQGDSSGDDSGSDENGDDSNNDNGVDDSNVNDNSNEDDHNGGGNDDNDNDNDNSGSGGGDDD
jgi:Domain of unknown function (DUF5667)/Domain of unknown function (DUF5666)